MSVCAHRMETPGSFTACGACSCSQEVRDEITAALTAEPATEEPA